VIGFWDLLIILNFRTLSIWGILARISNGGSFANIIWDFSKISVIISFIFLVDVVLYLLLIMSEMLINNFLPYGKK